jgi:hypothetical protein
MSVLVGTACLLLALGGYALYHRQGRDSDLTHTDLGGDHSIHPTGGPFSKDTAFKGSIDIRIWDNNNPLRRDVRLPDPDALPLKLGDLVRVEVRLNHPGYVYILWIDAAGKVIPVHPWQGGEWNTRPDQEHPVERLDLPDKRPDNGWPMSTPTRGMETLLMLVGTKPLQDDEVLKSLLVGLPVQKEQQLRAALWFENGEVVRNEKDRAPSFEVQAIDDPVLQTQLLIKDKLQPHFAYTRAVSFAYQGK